MRYSLLEAVAAALWRRRAAIEPQSDRLTRCRRVAALGLLGAAATLSAATAQEDVAPRKEAALSYTIVDGSSIPDPLATVAANVERGEELFADPEKGGCAECHAAPGVDVKPTRSGPPLDGVGARLSASAIRLWIVNPRALIEETTMPAYYSLDAEAATPGANRGAPSLAEPRLDAESIEDLVAFLESLK